MKLKLNLRIITAYKIPLACWGIEDEQAVNHLCNNNQHTD